MRAVLKSNSLYLLYKLGDDGYFWSVVTSLATGCKEKNAPPPNLLQRLDKRGAAGACAPPEFSGFSTKHCDVPPQNFGDYLKIHFF